MQSTLVTNMLKKISTLCFSIFTDASAVNMTLLPSVYVHSRHLCLSSDTSTLCIPFIKTKSFGQRTFSFTGPTKTRFVALHSKILPRCVPSDSVSQVLLSVYAHFVALGLVTVNSKTAHLLWLPRFQWYKRYKINKDSITFLTFTVILTLKTTI